jgi:hypothetical protein
MHKNNYNNALSSYNKICYTASRKSNTIKQKNGPVPICAIAKSPGVSLINNYNCVTSILMRSTLFRPFAKLRKATISFVMSVRPHGKTRLPPKGFSWNLILECFSKNCRENPNWNRTRTTCSLGEDQYTFLITCRWILLRMRNASDKSCRENQTTHVVIGNFFFKSCRLWDNAEKSCRAGQATDDNMANAHCMSDNKGYTHTQNK